MHKFYVSFPNVGFKDFLELHTYRSLKRPFYEANMMDFLELDIDEEGSISVFEFDLEAIPEPPFEDTPPEEVKKDLIEDYLIPLIERTKIKMQEQIILDYQKVQNFGDTAILNLKESALEDVNVLLIKAREVKHLPPKVKQKLLVSIKANLEFIDNNINTNFVLDSESKIKLRLGVKDICHLMLFFNEHELFDKKLTKTEIANTIEQHFQCQVGSKNEYKIITNASNSLSNSINSASHASVNPKLDKILVDLKKVLDRIPKG